MVSDLKLTVLQVLEVAKKDIPFGARGYMVDADGDITPIDAMYGHEAFVRQRSSTQLSVLNFVATKGWILFERDNTMAEIVYCPATVTIEAVAAAVSIVRNVYQDQVFTIREYYDDEDREVAVLSNANDDRAANFLVKLKVSLKSRKK